MEFRIEVRCKEEDKNSVREVVRGLSDKIFFSFEDSIREQANTGYNYRFRFTSKYRNLKKVLYRLQNEMLIGHNFEVRIEDWVI